MQFEKMSCRVTFLSVTEVIDPLTFEPRKSYAEIKVWGDFREAKSKETFELNRVADNGLATLYIRYRADIDPTWKVKDELGRVWRISGALRVLGRREGLEMSLELDG